LFRPIRRTAGCNPQPIVDFCGSGFRLKTNECDFALICLKLALRYPFRNPGTDPERSDDRMDFIIKNNEINQPNFMKSMIFDMEKTPDEG
jgi:hypothetical protein